MNLPALRYLDMMPIRHEGEDLICLRDPEGYVEEQMVLSPMAYFIAACLDGQTSIVDIQEVFAKETGGKLLMSDDILKIVGYLDEHGFLCNDSFETIRSKVVDTFAKNPVRPMYCAGKSYAAEEAELRAYLADLFAREHVEKAAATKIPLAGLIVPHIDFERGGASYAHGYGRMAQQDAPETVFIFGVAHCGASVPFILTRKSYETPLGTLQTDTGNVDQLAAACSWDPFAEEIIHRTEHSIEFQAVMLAYLFGPNVTIVPILCGAFASTAEEIEQLPNSDVARFLDCCREIVGKSDGKTTVVAGADLAHVGRRFGDQIDIDDLVARRIEEMDMGDLEHVEARDADRFYLSVMRDGNPRKVCGAACIYSALKTLGGQVAPGKLLHYGQAPDPAGGLVSFAGIAFPRKDAVGPIS